MIVHDNITASDNRQKRLIDVKQYIFRHVFLLKVQVRPQVFKISVILKHSNHSIFLDCHLKQEATVFLKNGPYQSLPSIGATCLRSQVYD